MQPRQAAYLLDILRSAEVIEAYIGVQTREEFLRDAKTQDAVLRRLLIAGEAAHVDQETEARFDRIPFRKMAGLRNRVVHDYGQIDMGIVWQVATLHLPQVRTEL